jgi:hypothetical protein
VLHHPKTFDVSAMVKSHNFGISLLEIKKSLAHYKLHKIRNGSSKAKAHPTPSRKSIPE